MPGTDIFISYSREDRAAARHFAACFADEGFSVWWDAELRAGEAFDQVIEDSLKSSKAVVVLWSPRSVSSRWVRAEATLADRRKKLVPIIIESCERPLIFELMHTSDLSDWSGDRSDPAWRSVLADLRQLVGKAAAPAAPMMRQAQPSPSEAILHRGFQGPRAETSTEAERQFAAAEKSAPSRRPPSPDVDDDDERTRFSMRSSSGQAAESEAFHCLELTVGGRMEKRFIIGAEGLKIGRAEPAAVILAEASVSRSHCKVELKDKRVQVTDLNSTNGTFVDGERIEGSAILDVGSTLRVGNVLFKHAVRSRAEV